MIRWLYTALAVFLVSHIAGCNSAAEKENQATRTIVVADEDRNKTLGELLPGLASAGSRSEPLRACLDETEQFSVSLTVGYKGEELERYRTALTEVNRNNRECMEDIQEDYKRRTIALCKQEGCDKKTGVACSEVIAAIPARIMGEAIEDCGVIWRE